MKEESGSFQQNRYPRKSAGRVMTSNVPTILATNTVADAEKLLREKTNVFETINYLYVLDKSRKPLGVISIKEIFRANPSEKIKQLMKTEVVKAHAYTDQERIAYLALKHSIKAVPVVDKKNTFLGIVPSDVILQILEVEQTEDILRFGGITHNGVVENVFTTPITTTLEHRTPWLILGLFGGILAAMIISAFEGILGQNIVLVAYIPLIVYVAGAVSNQTQAFIIRDLARDPNLKFFRYFLRQSRIVLFMAGIISLIFYSLTLLLHSDFLLSAVLATALVFTILTSLITGLIVPYLFGKMRFDPADASAPIGTITQDIVSVSVYIFVAGILLG